MWSIGDGGVAAVNEAEGRGGELPPFLRPQDKGEGPPPWTRPRGRRNFLCSGRSYGTLGKGRRRGRGRGDEKGVAAVVEDMEQVGVAAAFDEATGTAELPLTLTWTPVVGRGRRC